LYLEGSLNAPVTRALLDNVTTTLRRGVDLIVLDLAGIDTIDAAGVGELVRAYKMAVAAHCQLQIVHGSGWIREMLKRVALSEVLIDD